MDLTRAIVDGFDRARRLHPPFNSAHEGFAVLLEEVEELKAEVFKKHEARSKELMENEAIQVAATAMRFAFDICEVGK